MNQNSQQSPTNDNQSFKPNQGNAAHHEAEQTESFARPRPKDGSLATISGILGLASVICVGIGQAQFGSFVAVGAIATGSMALTRIKAGVARGKNNARAGILMGLVVAIYFAYVLFTMAVQKAAS